MTTRLGGALLLGSLVAASGCAPDQASPSAAVPGCVPVPVHIVLHFDPKRMWGTDLDRNAMVAVALRTDSPWSFDPGPPARLVDDAAHVVAHDGDIVYSACLDRDTRAYLIGPKDLPNQAPGA